jgi:hypothetical protein
MSGIITIQSKRLGSKKPLFPDWFISYPPTWPASGGYTTLRDLISRIVEEEVAAFRQRQEERRLFRALTASDVAQGARTGKIDPGGRDLEQTVDEAESVAVALQAFEDGLYFVFIDGQQQKELDHTVFVGPNSTVTFIRLVALAGGS